MDEQWHIRIDRHYLDPQAGAGARAEAEELAARKSGLRRMVEQVLDVRTEARNWRRGAVGEEKVAARLRTKLDERWTVIHDLTIGSRGANLDHLVIGPAGVFSLNTKHLTGRITVYDRAILHNGRNHGFLPKARAEAEKVSRRLSDVTGWPVQVQAVLVWTGPAEVRIEGRPADVRSFDSRGLARWLQQLPQDVVSPGDALRLERAARDPQTWSLTRRATNGGRRTSADPAPTSAPPTVPSAPSPPQRVEPAITIKRWTRYGKDRLYANGPDEAQLGFIDVPTGEVTLEGADVDGVIARRLRDARTQLR